MAKSARYSDFALTIDVDQFEAEIGWEPEDHQRGFDNGFCPDPWGLHKNGDTTGKFGIHRENRTFNCFVCGGGNLLSLTMAIKDCDEEEAIDFLVQFTRPVDQTDEAFMDEIDKILAVEKTKKRVWPYFNENVLTKWIVWATGLDEWCAGRGIPAEVAGRYKLGYDPEHVHRSKSKGDYVGPAIIFPVYWGERLVGWQRRWLDEDRPKHVPKYTNTHDLPQSEMLYGYEGVYLAETPIIVVESVPSKLRLEALGYPAVATFGSDISDEQIRLLRKCQQGVIFAPDNDKPGFKWYTARLPKYGEPEEPVVEKVARFVPVQLIAEVGNEGDNVADLPDDEVHAQIKAAKYYTGLPDEQ